MYEGKEVDIFIPSMKVGIEYDGRFFIRKKHRKEIIVKINFLKSLEFG